MHVIPLLLIILILIFILVYIQQPETDHASRTGKSRGHEPEISNGEDIFLRQGDLPQATADHTSESPTEVAYSGHERSGKAEVIEVSRESIERLQRDLSASISRNNEIQRRYEILSKGLDGAHHLLNTADTFSDSEVTQLTKRLNAELQHTSTFMADHVLSVFKLDAGKSTQERRVAVDSASKSVGTVLVQILQSSVRDDSDVAMYLQIALQAYLSYHLHYIVSSWTLDEGKNAFLNDIYQRLRGSEKQALSGRWRSLTHVYAVPKCVSEPNSLISRIVAGLSDILLAAGCASSRANIVSQLTSTFEKKLSPIVLLAGRLNQMIAEVVSGDFEVFLVRPGETFHAESMEEDLDGDETLGSSVKTQTAQTVLCMSELGLTKRVQLNDGEKETMTVIKAKVVLESFVDKKG